MSEPKAHLDRATIVATLTDYVAQLREEGMDGLPASERINAPTPAAAHGPRVAGKAATVDASPAHEAESKYPGLEKTESLETLREFIGDCRRCKLWGLRKNLVFGVGDPNAELMFIGEGPGAEEDARGEPFVGRAGQLLTDIIERGMGMQRAEVY
ncbi:MAG: uracil-DNA glycosylase, partial [Candidatus Binataceae bacterium]